ncbi:MAG: hypothetical protein LBU32_10830, partial [Clostridiales bacterium]|nr:hypothetical protein [Clostridiales bacterium]
QFSTKIHFMDICPCLKHTDGLIFSSLVVKRSFIGVSMKISIKGNFNLHIGIPLNASPLMEIPHESQF